MGACSPDLSFKVGPDLSRDVELTLRNARIPIDAKAGLPILILDVDCLRVTVGDRQVGYAVHLQLNLSQFVLIEDTKQRVVAMTWQTTDGMTCQTDSCANDIGNSAKNMTDEFINDFLKANQSK